MTSSVFMIIVALGGVLAGLGYVALVREARLLQRVRQRVDDDNPGA
jgi:hypothetical protein